MWQFLMSQGNNLTVICRGGGHHIKNWGWICRHLVWGESITKTFTYVQWNKGAIHTSNESIVWMHGVCTTMIRPIYKNTESIGFIFNPYNRCISNSAIDIYQCTISWYDNYNKVSRVEGKVNTRIIEKIAEHFVELTFLRGTKHNFLGMDIE